MHLHKKNASGLALLLFITGCLALTASAAPVISEFLAINDSVLADGDGDFSDWIEIHNPDVEDLDLGGYYLTDDDQNMTRWQIPAGAMLAGGGYLIIFASNKEPPPAGELHANFKLGGGGEFLALVAPDGTTIIDSFAPAFPPQFADTSYGRSNGNEAFYFPTPTPAAANTGGISDPSAVVSFSPTGGTFISSASITMDSAHPDGIIRYTTDGSDPGPGSPIYSGALNLNASTRLRARIFVPGEEPSPINSASYIRLGADVQNFSSPLPIIVIENFGAGAIPDKRASNPPAGDGGGITQVPRQAAVMTIIDRDEGGSAMLSHEASIMTRIGIRVRGSSSASQPAKRENYSIETWGAIDNDELDITPFEMPADDDWILYAPYNYDRALVRNAFVYDSIRLMDHYAARTRFVEVFVNTEGDELSMNDFAGVFVFMEKIKSSNDRVNIDDFSTDGTRGGWLLESNRKDPLPTDGSGTPPFNFHTAGPNRIQQGPYGGSSGTDQGGDDIPTGYNTFLNFVEPSGYETTQDQRDSIVSWFASFEDALYCDDYRRPDVGYRAHLDLDSFIDHYLMVNLTRSVDGLQLSTFMYRPGTYGKLHLNPVWDYDRSMDSYDSRDNSTSGMWGQNFLWFPRLFQDPEFNQLFIDRWQELRHTILSTASMHARIDAMAAEITEPVAAANFARWDASNNRPRSGGWPAEIAHMKNWLATRAAWIDGQFLSPPEFQFNGNQVTMTSSDSGTIHYTLDDSDPRIPDLPGVEIDLFDPLDSATGFIPSIANGGETLGETWKGGSEPFDDTSWLTGSIGIGFDYLDFVDYGIDVAAMRGQTGSCYMRIPFEVDASTLATINSLVLDMKFEDGFVAWINGVEVASFNKPNPLTWDAVTDISRSDTDALVDEPFDLTAFISSLQPGGNILAIQVMNQSLNNQDLLGIPRLTASSGSQGGISPQSMEYNTPLDLNSSTRIIARLEQSGEWSGPVDVSFLIDTIAASAENLVVSEIMYRPGDATLSELMAGVSDRDEFEFLELQNISASDTIDLTGVRLVETDIGGDLQGIAFDFDDGRVRFLHPGQRMVIVENENAFALRYGSTGRNIAGEYSGALSNDGETLTLLDTNGEPIKAFTYNDQLPWPTAADGDGYSLVLVDPARNPEHNNPLNWCSSASLSGTPGEDDSLPFSGTAGEDLDADGLTALVEHALGTSDTSSASGSERIVTGIENLNVEGSLGEYLAFTVTRDLRAKDVQLLVEYSAQLINWAAVPGILHDRTNNGDGTETLVFRGAEPVNENERGFARLRVSAAE